MDLLSGLSGLNGVDIVGITNMAKNLVQECDLDGLDNMNSEDASKHIAANVMDKVFSGDSAFDINKLMGTQMTSATVNPNDIVYPVTVNVTDLISGNPKKKIRYKRLVNKKVVKAKVFIEMVPMVYKTTYTIEGEGDVDGDLVGDLIVQLKVEKTNNVSIDGNRNIHCNIEREETSPVKIDESVKQKLFVEVTDGDISSVTYVLKEKGLTLDGGKTDLHVTCNM